MKWKLLVIMILMATSVYGIEECKTIIEPSDVPCLVTSLWNYTPPCDQYNATVWDKTGSNIINYTFGDYGNSNFCNFTWNISTVGSYIYKVSNGDSGTIHIEVDNLMVGITIGIGIIIALLLTIAFNLTEDMGWVKFYLIVIALSMASIIPTTFVVYDTSVIFHKAYQLFLRITWGMIFIYFSYKVLVWLGMVVPGENQK